MKVETVVGVLVRTMAAAQAEAREETKPLAELEASIAQQLPGACYTLIGQAAAQARQCMAGVVATRMRQLRVLGEVTAAYPRANSRAERRVLVYAARVADELVTAVYDGAMPQARALLTQSSFRAATTAAGAAS